MKNYEDMSDFEINKMVAKELGFVVDSDQSASLKAKSNSALVNSAFSAFEFNPCNNWEDIWPIIEKHGITLEYDYDLKPDAEWWSCVAFGDFGKVECNYLSNPRRAAAICFLMMQESK